MYLILAFIVVHLAGVFLAERKDSKGIVSDMINGGGEVYSRKRSRNIWVVQCLSNTIT
jgi:cytochrome b